MMNITKMCSRCGEEKTSSEFGKHSNRRDRLQSYCKECQRAYREEHKGQYLYLIYRGKECVYVGSTNNIDGRISNHTNLHSNIKNHMKKRDWTSIKVLDLNPYLTDNADKERFFIEGLVIEMLEPSWNVAGKGTINIDHSRALELYGLMEEFLGSADRLFEVYKVNKDVYKDLYYSNVNLLKCRM